MPASDNPNFDQQSTLDREILAELAAKARIELNTLTRRQGTILSDADLVFICRTYCIPLSLHRKVRDARSLYSDGVAGVSPIPPKQKQKRFEALIAKPDLWSSVGFPVDASDFIQGELDAFAACSDEMSRRDTPPARASEPRLENVRWAIVDLFRSRPTQSRRDPTVVSAAARRAAANQVILRGRPPYPWHLNSALRGLRAVWLHAGHPPPRWSGKRYAGSKAEAFPSFVEDVLCYVRPSDRNHVRRATRTKLKASKTPTD